MSLGCQEPCIGRSPQEATRRCAGRRAGGRGGGASVTGCHRLEKSSSEKPQPLLPGRGPHVMEMVRCTRRHPPRLWSTSENAASTSGPNRPHGHLKYMSRASPHTPSSGRSARPGFFPTGDRTGQMLNGSRRHASSGRSSFCLHQGRRRQEASGSVCARPPQQAAREPAGRREGSRSGRVSLRRLEEHLSPRPYLAVLPSGFLGQAEVSLADEWRGGSVPRTVMVAEEQLRRRDRATWPGKLPRCLGPGWPDAGRGCGRRLLGPCFCVRAVHLVGGAWARPHCGCHGGGMGVAGRISDGHVTDSGTQRCTRRTPTTAAPRPDPVCPAGPPMQGCGPLRGRGRTQVCVDLSASQFHQKGRGGALAARESVLCDLIAEVTSLFRVLVRSKSRPRLCPREGPTQE